MDDSNPNVVYGEFNRTHLALHAATQLHAAALKRRSAKRDQELQDLIRAYYAWLCAKVRRRECSSKVESDDLDLDGSKEKVLIAAHDEFVANAGGPQNSAMTRNSRYVVEIKDILWPPEDGEIILTSDGKLSQRNLRRAMDSLGDKKTRAALRAKPVPDYEVERNLMETQLCEMNDRRRECEQRRIESEQIAIRAARKALEMKPPSSRANRQELFPEGVPDDTDIVDLVVLLDAGKNEEKSMNQIARECTGETHPNDKKARRLLARVRKMVTL